MSPHKLALRFALAAAAAAGLLLLVGRDIVSVLGPSLALATDLVSPHLVAHVTVVGEGLHASIAADATAVAPVAVGRHALVTPMTPLGPVTTHLVHGLVPVVLLVAGLAAWPCNSRRELIGRIALGVPASLLVLTVTLSLHLAGLLELSLADLQARGGATMPQPWLVMSLLYLEAGGRWLIPLATAVAVVALARWRPAMRPPRARAEQVSAELVEIARRTRVGDVRGSEAVRP